MAVSYNTGAAAPANRQPIKWDKVGWFALLIVLAIVMILPLFWVITTALKSNNDIYKTPPDFFPNEFHFENFWNGFQAINFGRLFLNTMIITVLSVIGGVVSSMIIGYALARIKFPGRKIWFFLFIGSMMFPSIVTLIPLFRLYLSINWYDTWLPLIVPAWLGNPFFIFLARQFYLTIPYDLDESAKLDGAGHFTILTRIMAPITKPVWITMAIMAFQGSWNDYLNPLVYLQSAEKWTLSIGMATFSSTFAGVANTQWNLYMAANLLYMLPPLIFFFLAQRYFVQGLGSLGNISQK
ncbi:MAG: carbohydrate ABC transporter permease [Chloroflexi bacterium]|nr:carbohydrate ABC transporter permease [Chloroflexota bacterium]OJW02708.1 MAG: ABC transporter permease [Chloroflexi bacterium 54-19]